MSETIFISAGDVSGDLHAANLAEALKKTVPGLRIAAVGEAAEGSER